MDLSTKSLAELNLMTKAQLVAALTEDRRETKPIISTGDKRGQLRQVMETRKLDGSLESTSETTWTYFPNGNVDTITTTERSAVGKVIGQPKVVRHEETGGLLVRHAEMGGLLA